MYLIISSRNQEEFIGIDLNKFQKYCVELKNKLLTDTARGQPQNFKKTVAIVHVVKVNKYTTE